MSSHFVSPHCLMKQGSQYGYTSTISVSPLSVFKKHPKQFDSPNYVPQLPRELCHAAVFKKETEEDTMSTHFVFPHNVMKKGEPLRIHSYSFCIPSRLKEKSEVVFSCPISWHNYRGICVTRLSSKKEQKRVRVLHMSYPCTVWWKRGKRCGFTFTLWVSTLCLQKVLRSRFPCPGQ